MSWFKIDDKLHDHRKARKAGKAAMGVWVLAGSWSADNETDGFVPEDVLSRWGTPADAAKLVAAGLWAAETFQGEKGWRFHDWSHFQPSAAVTAAKREAERQSGLRGNHKRWHVERQISDPDCDYCYRVPDGEPDWVPDRVGIGLPESGANRPVPVPEPDPTEDAKASSTSRPMGDELDRFDEFWDAYDKKVGRKAAEAKWRLALKKPGIDADLLISAAFAYVSWQKSENKHPDFTKDAARWLNGEHWTDERIGRSTPATNVQSHMALVRQLGEEPLPLPQIGSGR